MKKFADMRRSERTLEVNQQVYLRLQPYRQTSLVTRRALKLASKILWSIYSLEESWGCGL
jgi:hypothetical protein